MDLDVDVNKQFTQRGEECEDVVAHVKAAQPGAPQRACEGDGRGELVKVEDHEHTVGVEVCRHSFERALGSFHERQAIRAQGSIGSEAEIDCEEIVLDQTRSRTFPMRAREHCCGKVDADDFSRAGAIERRKVEAGSAGEVDDTIPRVHVEKVKRAIASRQEPAARGVIDRSLRLVEAVNALGGHASEPSGLTANGPTSYPRGGRYTMRRLSPRTMAGIALFLFTQGITVIESSAAPETIATFSIVGCDPETGELGVAVQSRFFAVGSVVPWAKAGVGAIATQAFGNTTFGPGGLELLAKGLSPQATLDALIAPDEGRERRQVGIVDAKGNSFSYTGKECQAWAGGHTGKNYAAQGNILVSQATVDAMAKAFENTKGMLGERLLRALEEGQKAGGDSRGMQSAAILIVKEKGGYGGFNDRYCDLRVDDAVEPIRELRRIFDMWKVQALITEGYRYVEEKDFEHAYKVGKEALALGSKDGQPEYHMACYLSRGGKSEEALDMLATAVKRDPGLAKNAQGDPDFEPLRKDPRFTKLVGEPEKTGKS